MALQHRHDGQTQTHKQQKVGEWAQQRTHAQNYQTYQNHPVLSCLFLYCSRKQPSIHHGLQPLVRDLTPLHLVVNRLKHSVLLSPHRREHTLVRRLATRCGLRTRE